MTQILFSLSIISLGAAVGIAGAQATQATTPDAASTSEPQCRQGPAGGACQHQAAIFAAPLNPNGGGHRTLVQHDLETYGPSINFGNAGGWTVTHVIEAPHIVFGTSGIDQYEGANIIKNGVGDLAGLYLYVYGGGRAAQSDEGVEGLVVESGEINGYFHGRVASPAGMGAEALRLESAPGSAHNWPNTCAGCMLLNLSKGTIAGSLNGESQPFGATYLNRLPVTRVTVKGAAATLPLTSAWCTTETAIPTATLAGKGTARTVRCTLGRIGRGTPSFTAGDVVTIAGPSYPEQALLTEASHAAGGVQVLTLVARNPNPAGALVFQGGIAGQSLSFDDNLAATGFRTSYYVFGSVDGTNLIYGRVSAGSLLHRQLPRSGAEAEQPGSGFHLYPGAEVVANTASPASPLIEPNRVDWAVGDEVENPRYQSFAGIGIRDACRQVTPTDESTTSSCLSVGMGGPGISGTYRPFRLINTNPIGMYRQGGGVLDPVPALSLEGAYGDLVTSYAGPSRGPDGVGSVIRIINNATPDGTPFNLFKLPGATHPNAATVTYDPVTLQVGFPQGLETGRLQTAGKCIAVAAHNNCGNSAAGSIALPGGATSITVNDSAVTARSQILVTADMSLDHQLGVNCSKATAVAFAAFGVTARVPGKSFTLATTGAGGGCYSFMIVN